jgi:hypothetical protein
MQLPEFNILTAYFLINLPEFSWFFQAFARISMVFKIFFLGGELPPRLYKHKYSTRQHAQCYNFHVCGRMAICIVSVVIP